MAISKLTLTFVAVLCLFAQLVLQPTPVFAASPPQCQPRDKILSILAKKHKEAPVAFGLTNKGGLVEVLKSTPDADHDTWTIIITSPDGKITCLVAAGQGWRGIEQKLLDPET